jgi:phosphoglycolate phosphatase
MLNIAVLVSGGGSNLQAIIDNIENGGITNGKIVTVVSNKPDEGVQTLCIDHFSGCFDHAAGEKAGIKRKPAPDMIYAALEDMGIAPEDAVYVGDTEVDIETARNSGLDCICVDWGFRSRKQLLDCGAETIVSTCEELQSALLQA